MRQLASHLLTPRLRLPLGRNYLLVFTLLSLMCCNVQAEDRAQTTFRNDDVRPLRDEARAARLGIHKYESKHLKLYSDVDPEICRDLPGMVDQAYQAWTAYFGELPPSRDGKPFQITGYLLEDEQLFDQAGMMPEGFVMAKFGRQIGREFWMREQKNPYYRRHLLIHEATHAFMTETPQYLPPLWYLEGMAEFFATHEIDADGKIKFAVSPANTLNFPGLGRIEVIQEENFHRRTINLSRLGRYTSEEFIDARAVPYAWSWAGCHFLEHHPRYRERFHQLATRLEASQFQEFMRTRFQHDQRLLSAEWYDYALRCQYGFNVAANAFHPTDPTAWPDSGQLTQSLPADQNWTSTGLVVNPGEQVAITGTGRVKIFCRDQLYESESAGITLQYAGGFPVGALLSAWLPVEAPENSVDDYRLTIHPIGQSRSIRTPVKSELWLRVNSDGATISKNTGEFEVQLVKTVENAW